MRILKRPLGVKLEPGEAVSRGKVHWFSELQCSEGFRERNAGAWGAVSRSPALEFS